MSFLEDHYLAITIDDVEIDLSRAKNKAKTAVNEVAIVQPAPFETLTLDQALVNELSTELGDLFPSGLSITIKDVSFAISDKPLGNSGSADGKVIAANFGLDIDFSELPLVGHMFPADLKFSVEDIQVLFSTAAISDSSTLSDRLPSDIAPFPKVISKGVNFIAKVNAGEDTITISSGSIQKLHAAATPNQNTASGGKQSQGNVNKKFGPVFIQSVGINFQNGDLNFVITGSIKLGPLTVTLDQLQIGSPLNEFSPKADLHGLAVDYKKNKVNIGGGLVKTTDAAGLTVYNGALAVDLTKFQLSAIGSYTDDHGDPSFFVFAQLNEPLGGPSFFFVTGLAFAFGLNRNLIKPKVQDVSTFPLIKAATGSIAPPKAGATSLIPAGMNTYLPPQLGEYFLGVGVKFTSFKVINSFALFIVKFGKELEFDLLGISSYIAPNPKDPKPVATVELEIVGSYKPSTGDLLIRGMLTPNSFVLSKECHLQGGFAIACWTDPSPYSGEFVFSFGGYGSHYTPQPYYPQGIPELGFLWQVNSNLSIKGGGYWTLTPHRIVAGGFLKAVYNLDWVRASFNMDAFFEIDWSPLHYEGEFSVEFSLEVHVDLLFISCWMGFTIGEALSIHGPEFGGTASISLYVCTVDIAFGAAPAPKPLLPWTTFRDSYTPCKLVPVSGDVPAHTTGMVKINLTSGLVKKEKNSAGEEVLVINAKDLCLSVSTFVPNTSYQLGSTAPAAKAANNNKNGFGPEFGIKPMGLDFPKDDVTGKPTSELVITTTYTSEGIPAPADDQFQLVEVEGNVPKAMWGIPGDTDDTTTVISALTGVDIQPAKPPKPGETAAVPKSELAWENMHRDNSFQWTTLPAFTQESPQPSVSTAFGESTTNQASILEALGYTAVPDDMDSALQTRLTNTNGFLVGSL